MLPLLRVWHYLRPHWAPAVLLCVIVVAAAVVALLVPWPLQLLVDHVLAGRSLPPALSWLPRSLTDHPVPLVTLVVGAGLLVAALDGALGVVSTYVSTRLDQRMATS